MGRKEVIEVQATPFSIVPLEKLPKSTASGMPENTNTAPAAGPVPDETESSDESVPF